MVSLGFGRRRFLNDALVQVVLIRLTDNMPTGSALSRSHPVLFSIPQPEIRVSLSEYRSLADTSLF